MNLLLVEDEAETAAALAHELRTLGYSVTVARDGRDAIFYAGDQPFDAIVLDRLLPLVDGVDVVKRLRDTANTVPVLMVSALGDLVHRLEGLDGGADDYLVKPAAPAEIHARLQAIFRRSIGPVAHKPPSVHGIDMDIVSRAASVAGRPIRLTPIEFSILRELIKHVGQIVTKKMLLEAVWGYHFEPESNIVEMHIAKLRAQLRYAGLDDIITTVRLSGYLIREQ